MQHTTSPASPVSAVAGDTVVHRWAQDTASVPRARRALRQTLRDWQLGDLADDCALVLCELLANAVEHSRNPDGTVLTRFSRLAHSSGVRIEVRDADAGRLPLLRTAGGGEDERGRGLRLVEEYARSTWGVEVGAGGKAVWAEVAR